MLKFKSVHIISGLLLEVFKLFFANILPNAANFFHNIKGRNIRIISYDLWSCLFVIRQKYSQNCYLHLWQRAYMVLRASWVYQVSYCSEWALEVLWCTFLYLKNFIRFEFYVNFTLLSKFFASLLLFFGETLPELCNLLDDFSHLNSWVLPHDLISPLYLRSD